MAQRPGETNAEYLRRSMQQAVRDSEAAHQKWKRLTSSDNFDDRYKAATSTMGKDILSEGEWAHRRAQTFAAALTAELAWEARQGQELRELVMGPDA